MKQSGSIKVKTLDEGIIRTKDSHNQLSQRPKIDLDRTSSENSPGKRLVRFAYEFAKSVIKISSKLQEPKTYNKIINNLVYKNIWQEVIDEEL